MRTIGIDIGYGFTKITDGDRQAVFPTVAGDAVEGDYSNDLIKRGHGVTLTVDGHDWFYGEHAQKHSRNPRTLFARERTEQTDLMHVLFRAALVELGITSGSVALCTGLPVAWYADKEDLETLLLGVHSFQMDHEKHEVIVQNVAIVPQPFGAFFDVFLAAGGQHIANPAFARGKVGILDAGTYTCDLAVAHGMEYIAKDSGSEKAGMSNVWRQVADGIQAQWGREYELHEIDRIMRDKEYPNVAEIAGKTRDVSDLVTSAVDALAQQVLTFVRSKWGRALDFNRVILTGGGAHYIAGAIKDAYPHNTLVLDAPENGNLRGFYKYAVRKFGVDL